MTRAGGAPKATETVDGPTCDPAGPPLDGAPTRTPVALYALDDVRAALGLAEIKTESVADELAWEELPRETELQTMLSKILERGEQGRWRHAVGPTVGTLRAIAELKAAAPHLGDLIRLFERNMQAALAMGLPSSIPPLLLVGGPGTGKSWLLERLARAVGSPFRAYPMNGSTLSEGIQGAHPSWRQAAPGLVARTLLREGEANPIVFVDEFDKATANAHNGDPYRPFYSLLDPSGAKAFHDEFLGFPVDASRVMWAMAANDASGIPPAILDRLTVVEVPVMTADQRAAVTSSIYAEANALRNTFFSPSLPDAARARLAGLHPRSVRVTIEDAMVRAAAEGRRQLAADDIVARSSPSRPRIGFR